MRQIEVFYASLSLPEFFESCEAGIAGSVCFFFFFSVGDGGGLVGGSVRDGGCHAGV